MLSEPVLNATQPGTFDKPLLVERPFASSGKTALGRCQHRLAEVGQASHPVLTCGMNLSEVQCPGGEPEPGHWGALAQLRREVRARELTDRQPGDAEQ
jgi:hypothetical protein